MVLSSTNIKRINQDINNEMILSPFLFNYSLIKVIIFLYIFKNISKILKKTKKKQNIIYSYLYTLLTIKILIYENNDKSIGT